MTDDNVLKEIYDLKTRLRTRRKQIIGFIILGIVMCILAIWFWGLIVGGIVIVVMELIILKKNYELEARLEKTLDRVTNYENRDRFS